MSTTLDVSKLPPPTVVETLDFETHYTRIRSRLVALYPAAAGALESDAEPLTKLLQVMAYEIMNERMARNDSALAVMLAYAEGADLDQIGDRFNLPRLVITPADLEAIPPTLAVMEKDEPYRLRIRERNRVLSQIGTAAAYESFAKGADGDVLDARASSPTPGTIMVTVLARSNSGMAGPELLATVLAAVSHDDARAMTDEVMTQSAELVDYTIRATVYHDGGPGAAGLLAQLQAHAQAVADEVHRIGARVSLSKIYDALQQSGVVEVDLAEPAASMTTTLEQAPRCIAINITLAAADEESEA
ncbi:baseplate assembly protein [Hylemonella gracilis str. Niagara R]|uniref:Baseplate assembly protein n=1 Tax=Hylemonella gracilis str. Niagara R TaxID=1458275 RepID=A0A016XHS1_9BURK|nr:baseplate J/gp47 family protein [Hylemonella gracilis]EYC51450.1 baseplate assembly protein [Hylemonella gracilis str. Niagara R]